MEKDNNIASFFLVRDLMHGDLEWVTMNDTCLLAAQKMLQRKVGALPVRDNKSGLLSGIVTDRDIVIRVLARNLDPSRTNISAAVTVAPLALVFDDESLLRAEEIMIEREVRRLLVQRRSAPSEVIGILSVEDIARAGLARQAGEVMRSTAADHPHSMTTGRPIELAPVTTADITQTGKKDVSLYCVNDVIVRRVEWVEENDNCRAAAKKMLERNIGCLPVNSKDRPNHIIGVLTDRDLITRIVSVALSADTTLVRDVMSKEIVTCYSDENLADAQALMIAASVRRLPVLHRVTNEVIGILSIDDIALCASMERSGSILKMVSKPALPGASATTSSA